MNLKKMFAGTIASVLAVSTMAISASASIYIPPEGEEQPAPGCSIDANWLLQLYNTGNEAENKPAVDYGLDLQAIDSFTIYTELVSNPDPALGFPLEDYDVAIDGFGGNFIYSANGGDIGTATESDFYDEENGITLYGKYNWPNNNEWWGLPEAGDSPEGQEAQTNQGTVDYSKTLHMEYLNKFSYKMVFDISDVHADDPDYVWPAGGTCYQVGLQEWGNDMAFNLKVNLLVIRDADDNIMIAFDGLGNKLENDAAEALITEYETPKADEPEETEASEEDTSAAEDTDEPAGTEEASDNTTAAPAETTAAPAASSSSNNMLPIIIAIIAVVVIIVVIVVIVVVKKKKNS